MSVDIDQFILDYKRHALEDRHLPQINQSFQPPVVTTKHANQHPQQPHHLKPITSRLSTPEKPLVDRLTEGERRHQKFVEERKRDLQLELNSPRIQKTRRQPSESVDDASLLRLSTYNDELPEQKQQVDRTPFAEKKMLTSLSVLPQDKSLHSFESVPLSSALIHPGTLVLTQSRFQISSRADELLRQVQELRNSSSRNPSISRYFSGSLQNIPGLNISRSFAMAPSWDPGHFPKSDFPPLRLDPMLPARDLTYNQLTTRNTSFSNKPTESPLHSTLVQIQLDKLAEFERRLQELDRIRERQKTVSTRTRSSSLERPHIREDNSLSLVLSEESDEASQRKRQEAYRSELERQFKERNQAGQYPYSRIKNSSPTDKTDIFGLTQFDNAVPDTRSYEGDSKQTSKETGRGLIFTSDEERKEAMKRQQEKFAKELSAQIEERKLERERQQREQEEYDKRKMEEMANFEPFGRKGGGAPLKDTARSSSQEDEKIHVQTLSTSPYISPRAQYPPNYTESSRILQEFGHARGGNGIFGEPMSDTQKTVVNQYKEELMKQIEEKKKRVEMERQKVVEAEKMELKRLQEEQAKLERDKVEEEKKKREFEKAREQENHERENRKEDKGEGSMVVSTKQSVRNVPKLELENRISAPSSNRFDETADGKSAFQLLRLMREKLENELKRTADSLLTSSSNQDDLIQTDHRDPTKRPLKAVKVSRVTSPSHFNIEVSGDADKRSMDTTEAELIVNEFVGEDAQRYGSPLRQRIRKTSAQSLLLDSESAFLRLSQNLRQSISGHGSRLGLSEFLDDATLMNFNELDRRNDERRQRLLRMQEDIQSMSTADPENVISRFLIRQDQDSHPFHDGVYAENPSKSFATPRKLLQSSGSLHSQLVNESELHPIDTLNQQIFSST